MIRRITFVFVVLALLTPFSVQTIAITTATARDLDGSGIWHIAPTAPTISEVERMAELAARRDAVMKRVGERGMLVLFSAEPRVYTNDVDYHYRQENNLYYLTGIKQSGATLVLIPGAKKVRE